MAIETRETQFSDTPSGWAARIKREFEAAEKALKTWRTDADDALRAYLDEREGTATAETRWNIYASDVQTIEAMLLGKAPKVTVTRRFADADDDVARVAGVIQERILNTDVERKDDTFMQALEYAASDWLRVGLGVARVRYVPGESEETEAVEAKEDEAGNVLAPAVPATETFPDEQVETDYIHHKDFLYSPCRVQHEMTWQAFGAELTLKEVEQRFGEDVAAAVPTLDAKDKDREKEARTPWDKVRLWEVWFKPTRQVFFYVPGHPVVLRPLDAQNMGENGGQADPLGLDGFFPTPRLLVSNVTTSKFVPVPDYKLAKDLYEEINTLSTRITLLERAVRVVGIYDKTAAPELSKLMAEEGNAMLPVQNFAALGEKGGFKGVVDWFPLEQVVNALVVLRDYRSEQVDALRQITGMADIMRGEGDAGATATQDRIKARFGSVRMQRRQQEIARFASELQSLRAEVMSRHFDEATLLARCNCERTPDAQFAPEAVKLLKSELAKYRIEVKPEAISMTDFDALKQERTEVVSAIGGYFTAIGPIMEKTAGATPEFLRILKWLISGLRGSSEMEGILDAAIAKAEKAAEAAAQQGSPPDPKMATEQLKAQTQQMKAQADMAKEQFKFQAGQAQLQAEVQADAAREKAQADQGIRQSVVDHMLTAEEQAAQRAHDEKMVRLKPAPKPGGGGK